ncbi:Hsp20/alpha crystallin family protein [Propionivibrio sp.]|uniref:Hsp20/alpha crystallin family protein n=1 Tax=Propionivibrio sp. TaxID=2212460 RepID=UPI003BF0281D
MLAMRRRNTGFWIWAEALDLLRNAERLQRRVVAQDALQAVPCWEPAVDLYEQGDELKLFVALPGVSPRQFEVILEGAGLVVRGSRPIPSALQRAAIHRLEIPYGRFERRITLPPGRFRLHKQFFEDGCLAIVLRHL